jgi:uncharacterized protein YyaL (SSP411 family)
MADIHWQQFEPDALARARSEDRPILLVLTKPWCTHCRALLEETMRDAGVVKIVRDRFIAIRVDAERRPDVNERYGSGSWPTVAYLTPDGALIANDGFLTADVLTERLQRVLETLANDRTELEERIESLWSNTDRAIASESAGGELNREIVDDVVDAIWESFDHKHGGWGETAKFPHPEAIDFALVQVVKRDDQRMDEVVRTTLERMARSPSQDEIDGGFFRYSTTPDWRSPVFEKLLEGNALRLRCYLEAFQIYEQPVYREAAEGIVRWMIEFMLDEEAGAFFGSQAADPDYYALDREARRRREAPRLDRTIYTNANAIAISSLLKASVVLDRPELRDIAYRTLDFLKDHLVDGRDGVFHYWDGTYHLPGLLADQALLIRAMIDVSQHSGDADHLRPAEEIAERVIKHQRAPGGGFWDVLDDPRQSRAMRRRNRSILDNSWMAESLLRLSYLVHRRDFHDEAVRTLEAFVSSYKEYGFYVSGYGRAVDLIFYQPMVVTIVGRHGDEATDALRRAALGPYVPSRIVQTLDPERDPILMGRSGLAQQGDDGNGPRARIALGLDVKGEARTPSELVETMMQLEEQRRGERN